MKIIQVYQTNPFENVQGGGVRYVKNLIFSLEDQVEEVLFFGVGESREKRGKIELIPVTSNLGGYPKFLLKLFLKVLFINLSRYDVVHVHRLYFALPFIILKPQVKIVCSLHGRTFSVFESNYGKRALNLVRPIFMGIEKFCLTKVDFLVPVSNDVLNNFSSKYPIKKPIKIIGSMFNSKGFKLQPATFLQDSYGDQYHYILFLGRLADVKNVDFLIKMWSKCYQNSQNKNLKLIIAGDGECGEELKELSNSICLFNKPMFIGEINPDKIPQLLSSSTVCLLSSKHEASPTIVKEALSSGIPLVTNKVGDVDEFIINGVNGFIVQETYEDYARAISHLLSNTIPKEKIYSASAPMLEACTVENRALQYLELYKILAK